MPRSSAFTYCVVKIKLTHAGSYAAWGKGKIENFFQPIHRDFQERLRLEPVGDFPALNAQVWHSLESQYITEPTVLWSPMSAGSLRPKIDRLAPVTSDTDWRRLF